MLYDIDFKVNQKLKRTSFESLLGRKYFATFLVNLITDTYVAGAPDVSWFLGNERSFAYFHLRKFSRLSHCLTANLFVETFPSQNLSF